MRIRRRLRFVQCLRSNASGLPPRNQEPARCQPGMRNLGRRSIEARQGFFLLIFFGPIAEQSMARAIDARGFLLSDEQEPTLALCRLRWGWRCDFRGQPRGLRPLEGWLSNPTPLAIHEDGEAVLTPGQQSMGHDLSFVCGLLPKIAKNQPEWWRSNGEMVDLSRRSLVARGSPAKNTSLAPFFDGLAQSLRPAGRPKWPLLTFGS